MTTLNITFPSTDTPVIGAYLEKIAVPVTFRPLGHGTETTEATIYAVEFLDLIAVIAFLHAIDIIHMTPPTKPTKELKY